MLARFGVPGPSILWHLIAGPLAVTIALPQPHLEIEQQYLSPQTEDFGDDWRKYVLPVFDGTPSERADQIERNRKGYLYGASLLGNTSYFPTGLLGDAMVERDVDLWYEDAAWVSENVARESQLAAAAVGMVKYCSAFEPRMKLTTVRAGACRISQVLACSMTINGSLLCQPELLLEPRRIIHKISFSPWNDSR